MKRREALRRIGSGGLAVVLGLPLLTKKLPVIIMPWICPLSGMAHYPPRRNKSEIVIETQVIDGLC